MSSLFRPFWTKNDVGRRSGTLAMTAESDTQGEQHGHQHRDVSGGWLRPAVFGAMDGLVTNVSLIAGVGGAYFTIGSVGGFSKNITSGYGFIALAALIFGRWSPRGAVAAALLFGFFSALNTLLSINVPNIPSTFVAMLPYVATIFAVAGLVGRVRAPAADGEPYTKE